MWRTALALGLVVACHEKEAQHREPPAKPPEAVPVAAPVAPMTTPSAKPAIDPDWIDRCLGDRNQLAAEPTHLVTAVAAARAALDGATDVPQVEVQSYAPQRQAEIAMSVASATLAAKRDAGPLLDGAFAAAKAVTDAAKRDRVLLWGAIELRRHDATRAQAWAAAIKDAGDYRSELAAHEVVRLASAGDGAAAGKALAALPPMWGLRSDVESWPGYPRWLGSAAATACVALAAPAFAASPDARALVDAAEKLTAKVGEEWRQNREYRVLALAYARLGDLDRAMAATSRMPGSERAGAIAAVLDDFGDAPGIDIARLGALAQKAIAATRAAPFVLADPGTDPTAMHDFVAQAVAGEVVAALVRRQLKRGDLTAAQTTADAIPDNLSKHHEAAVQVACARKGKPDAIVAALPAAYDANLAEAAAQVGCLDVMERLLMRASYGRRIAENIAWRTIARGHLDEARAMLRELPQLAPADAAAIHGELAFALARAGRAADAVATLDAIPAQQYKNIEQAVVAAGYRGVVSLVALGDVAGAKALDAALAPRLARVR